MMGGDVSSGLRETERLSSEARARCSGTLRRTLRLWRCNSRRWYVRWVHLFDEGYKVICLRCVEVRVNSRFLNEAH